MSKSGSAARACALVCVVASACGEAGGAADPTGATVLEITDVPAGVRCLRFAVQSPGAAAASVDRDVAGGGAATVSLGALPGGGTTLSAQAFTVACAGVTAATAPAWIAAPQTYEIRAGYRNEIEMTFRPNTEVIARGDFVVPVRSIAVGRQFATAVLQDGTVRRWGWHVVGSNPLRPTAMSLANVAQVAGGDYHACALLASGAVWCWGSNQNGQLGNGTEAESAEPVLVAGGRSFSQIDLGPRHSCGLSGEQVYCWGERWAFGGEGEALTPELLPGSAAGAQEVRAGVGTCLRARNSRVYCIGPNLHGALGLGSRGTFTTLTQSVYPIASAFDVGLTNACAVDLVGAVRCAGLNDYGQLGSASTAAEELTPVAALVTNVTSVRAGGFFSCALRADGTVWCWGSGTFGQVGAAAAAGVNAGVRPTQVAGLSDVIQLEAGYEFACALRRDGSVWCWGNNEFGQIGDGTNTIRYTPVRVLF